VVDLGEVVDELEVVDEELEEARDWREEEGSSQTRHYGIIIMPIASGWCNRNGKGRGRPTCSMGRRKTPTFGFQKLMNLNSKHRRREKSFIMRHVSHFC